MRTDTEPRDYAQSVVLGAMIVIATYVVMMAVGGAIGWKLVAWSNYRSAVAVAIVWSTSSAFLAFAVGGWSAGRPFTEVGKQIIAGLLTGAICVILFLILLGIATCQYGDLRSIAIELGWVDVPPSGPIEAPFFDAEGDPIVEPSQRAPEVILASAAYVLVTIVLLVGASAFGAMASRQPVSAGRRAERSRDPRKHRV